MIWSSLQSHEFHDAQMSYWPLILTSIHMGKTFRYISVMGRIVRIFEVDLCLRSLFLGHALYVQSQCLLVLRAVGTFSNRLGSILERFARNTVLKGLCMCVCVCTHCWHTGIADSRWGLAGSQTGSRAQRESSFPMVGRAVGSLSHMMALEEKVNMFLFFQQYTSLSERWKTMKHLR